MPYQLDREATTPSARRRARLNRKLTPPAFFLFLFFLWKKKSCPVTLFLAKKNRNSDKVERRLPSCNPSRPKRRCVTWY